MGDDVKSNNSGGGRRKELQKAKAGLRSPEAMARRAAKRAALGDSGAGGSSANATKVEEAPASKATPANASEKSSAPIKSSRSPAAIARREAKRAGLNATTSTPPSNEATPQAPKVKRPREDVQGGAEGVGFGSGKGSNGSARHEGESGKGSGSGKGGKGSERGKGSKGGKGNKGGKGGDGGKGKGKGGKGGKGGKAGGGNDLSAKKTEEKAILKSDWKPKESDTWGDAGTATLQKNAQLRKQLVEAPETLSAEVLFQDMNSLKMQQWSLCDSLDYQVKSLFEVLTVYPISRLFHRTKNELRC